MCSPFIFYCTDLCLFHVSHSLAVNHLLCVEKGKKYTLAIPFLFLPELQEPDTGYGEVLLSISYLPAANRLLVVLIKAKNLHSKQLKELIGKGMEKIKAC